MKSILGHHPVEKAKGAAQSIENMQRKVTDGAAEIPIWKIRKEAAPEHDARGTGEKPSLQQIVQAVDFLQDRDLGRGGNGSAFDIDEVDFVARRCAERALAQDPLDPSRLARLGEEEAAAPEIESPAPPPASKRSFGWVLVLWVIRAPFAVALRLFSMPWRGALRARALRRADRLRASGIERAIRFEREAAADDANALVACGLAWLAVGEMARGERAFDAAVAASKHDPMATVHLAAIENRGVARARMKLPKLAALDAAERRRLGPPTRRARGAQLREGLVMLRIGLGTLAGLDDD